MAKKPSHHLPRVLELDTIKRLLKNVREDQDTGCWVWRGHLSEKGYGQLWHDGRAHWAYRLAYAMFIDEIPAGKTVDHLCGYTDCVNPAHLELVTQQENSRRAARRHAA